MRRLRRKMHYRRYHMLWVTRHAHLLYITRIRMNHYQSILLQVVSWVYLHFIKLNIQIATAVLLCVDSSKV